MGRVGYTVLVLLVLATGHAFGQTPQPQDPNGAAYWFTPALPGLDATDFCTGTFAWPHAGRCAIQGTNNFGIRTGPNFERSVLHADAAGWIYVAELHPSQSTVIGTCQVNGAGTIYQAREFPIYRMSPDGAVEPVGAFREHCLDGPQGRFRKLEGAAEGNEGTGSIGLDMVNGILYVSVLFSGEPERVTKITGLPKLLDVILSYQPPSTLSFNVPAKPFALPGADTFSLYTGNLTTVSDLSRATPLACEVPAGRAPVPGEVLTVPDSLPDPEAGRGRYYLTTATHQGQRRAGRSEVGGMPQGRNAAVLPSCH